MGKRDLRKVHKNKRETIRKTVLAYREEQKTNREIAKELDIAESTASRIYSTYRKKSDAELKDKKRGRKENEVKRIQIIDERKIIEKMIDSLSMYSEEKRFWTVEALKVLIEEELNINISITTVRKYLKRWKLLDKKSILISKQANRNRVKKVWLWDVYSEIKKNARKENAEIFWVHSFYRIRFPEVLIKKSKLNRRWKIKCYQMKIVGPYGKKAFMLSSSRYDGYGLIKFLENFIKHSDRKIYLMLNIHKLYPMKPVKEWLAKHLDEIEVYYIPYK